VVINEVGWGGTAAASTDEWIELLNTTTQTLSLDGWVITSTAGLSVALTGSTIAGPGYYLIERSDDQTISDIPADRVANFGSGLANSGTTLFLTAFGQVIDTANRDPGGAWPAGSGAPGYLSMERVEPLGPDLGSNWQSNDGVRRNGLDAAGNPINGTPGQANASRVSLPSPTPPPVTASLSLLLGEFLYDGLVPGTEGDEFVEVCNPQAKAVDLAGYKIGDAVSRGSGEGMYLLPGGSPLAPASCLIVAKNAHQFQSRFGLLPHFEVVVSGASYQDHPAVTNLAKYSAWADGSWALANEADELLLLGLADEVVDSVAYRNGDFSGLALEAPASAPEPYSLQRVWPVDTNSMPHDFVVTDPSPGVITSLPPPPLKPPAPALMPGGMRAYWGDLHAHTTYSDGAGPPY
jgi:hypothetical protein